MPAAQPRSVTKQVSYLYVLLAVDTKLGPVGSDLFGRVE